MLTVPGFSSPSRELRPTMAMVTGAITSGSVITLMQAGRRGREAGPPGRRGAGRGPPQPRGAADPLGRLVVAPRPQLRHHRPPPAVHQLLAVLRHAPGLVVVDDGNDGEVVADHRVELAEVEADGAVTRHAEDAALGVRLLAGDGEGKAGAQTAQVPGGQPGG